MAREAGDPPQAAPRPSRREYTTPGVSWEEPFDLTANLASACNKGPFDGGACAVSAAS